MNSTTLFRNIIVNRLVEDFIGPLSTHEILTDRPTQRYSTGILYPRGSQILPEEDEDGGLAVNEMEDAASDPTSPGVSLHSTLKPSSAGLSFAVKSEKEGTLPSVKVQIRCARYTLFAVDDSGKESPDPPSDRSHERWRRIPYEVTLSIVLQAGENKVDLGSEGIEGLELYLLVTPYAELLTVTAALSNRRYRGDSRVYDEHQHFFQVELMILSVLNGSLVSRPSLRAQTDEDSRSAALIYRDVVEYAVGHTCSAQAVINGDEVCLKTEWIPAVIVPSVSDKGDKVFDTLRTDGARQPLESSWLATASQEDLVQGLGQLVDTYRNWINEEAKKIVQLPKDLRPQASKHLERCIHGADRMAEGVAAINQDPNVLRAFKLAQDAMQLQFGWLRDGAKLIWHPFQLGFQLLVIASLADRSHQGRNTMDLLWFPTGGGKTEAYLALAAFVIMLRRLRQAKNNDGEGVAVLMRYTLRLLTIQQFQRAAAMICACELLRRRAATQKDGIPPLGKTPFSIGLWVGAGATPLTLRDTLDRSPDDPSTPEQLTTCPSCGGKLRWKITPKESVVECDSEASECEFAASGKIIPIWTIDEEIYRNKPSLLIGTVDKFAQIVRKAETGVLFGRSTTFAPPDLIIQDELHLISGPLGSIAGLYEAAIDELCRKDNNRPKIIGSTATIRRAEEQIRALFDRDTYQFPAPGLNASNSGFAVTDTERPGRLYIGLTTAGRSATYTLQALTASLLQSASSPGASLEERDYYWSLVLYFNSLRELGHALVLMQDDVPVSIRQIAARRAEAPRKLEVPAELTSRVRAYEIRDMLDRLKKGPNDSEAVDLLLASNMISVGMDIPRLGIMVVNAQPKTLSEYIQATSRVGRGNVPGLVVTMYNSMRARDRSHYESFDTWHRSLYRDIEATSVTPFASRAQDKALHAVLVALVRHTIQGMERRPVLDDTRRSQVEAIAAIIEERVARVDPGERVKVSQKLKRLIDQWASRQDLQRYWDDYGRSTSLLMSAEQFAAKADVDADLDREGARRALWPTPNSMREVEAGAPFILRRVLKAGEA